MAFDSKAYGVVIFHKMLNEQLWNIQNTKEIDP